MKAIPLGMEIPGDLSWGSEQVQNFDPWLLQFECCQSDGPYVAESHMRVEEEGQIFVLRELVLHGNLWETRQQPVLFEDFIRHLPPREARQSRDGGGQTTRNSSGPSDWVHILRAEFPWLTDEDIGIHHRTQPRWG